MNRYKLVVRQEAKDEAEAIRAWYEEQSPDLGDRFVNGLDACFDELIENPNLQIRKESFRYARIKGFRYYRVVFTLDGQVITVYQVRHTSRRSHPKFGP